MNYLQILCAFILLIGFIEVKGQDEIAPLLKKVENASGKEKADLLNEISAVYRKTDRMKSLDYARQAYKLSLESKYLPGKALAKKNEGVIWFFIGKNDSATLCYKQALGIFTSIGDEKGKSACYNNLGLIAQETGKYDEALTYYQSSIDIDRKLRDEIGVAETKGNLVDIFIYLGHPYKALKLSNEILLIYKKHSNNEGIMKTLINRAANFDNMKRFDEAMLDQKEAIRIAREINDKFMEATALSNFGLVLWHKGYPDQALKILNQVLEMAEGEDYGYDILNTLWIIADIYSAKKEYALSNEILLKVLKNNEDKDDSRQEAKALTSLGRNLIELNEIDKALGYLTKSLEITIDLNSPYEQLDNYRNLAHAYAILHDFDKADSLQDCFANTYCILFNSDSTNIALNQGSTNNDVNVRSVSTSRDWIIAFLLFIIISIVSVYIYDNKKLLK